MFAIISRRLERALMGSFPKDVRRNVWVEMIASIWFGIFHAIAIAFMPVVLPAGWLATCAGAGWSIAVVGDGSSASTC
jgi:hypothetical protein